MEGSICLTSKERKRLLEIVRGADQVRRALALLLLDRGQPWSFVTVVLFCSSATLARWKSGYEIDGVDGLLTERRGRRGWSHWFRQGVVRWALKCTPREFGFVRTRWTCGLLAVVLWRTTGLDVSRETVRRWLHQAGLVWRRPRPVLGPVDPERNGKLRRIRRLLENLPASETAVFQDEVDINTNPKIGSMWMRRGQQAEVVTPGTNEKAYLAGSLHWRTGVLFATEGTRRNGPLFVAHLEELCRKLRRYRVIHVICDNAAFHRSRPVQEWLARHPRVRLHFLPTYAPETNPIERVWWHLHETVTRNHRCGSLDELLNQVFRWLGERTSHPIETSIYTTARAA
jgi:transposase